MNTLEQFFSEKNLFLSIFTIIFTIVYSFAVIYMLNVIRKRKAERRNKFINTCINGFIDNTIMDIDDIINIYSGITHHSTEDLTYKMELNRYLREIIAKLINKEYTKTLSNEQILSIKDKINSIIKKNEESNPYADLPNPERGIINDISTYNIHSDNKSIERKLKELSSVIITRNEQQKKVEAQNKWSIPLSVIGMILTILFGIISIIL